jgi:hypothetical protein
MMITLLLVLGGIMAYLFFDKGFWLDTWARSGEENMSNNKRRKQSGDNNNR